MSKSFTLAVMTALLLVSVSPAMAEVCTFRDPVRFDRLAQAPAVPIPDSQTAFPGTNRGIGVEGRRVPGEACKSLLAPTACREGSERAAADGIQSLVTTPITPVVRFKGFSCS